jgi:hypothetical protein
MVVNEVFMKISDFASNLLNRFYYAANSQNGYDFVVNLLNRYRIHSALSKGRSRMKARNVDLTRPETWEFSGFSQNGEDGILDVLRSQLLSNNRCCAEIGVEDGIQSNTAWLISKENYCGVMIEGNPTLAKRAKIITSFCFNVFVTRDNVHDFKSMVSNLSPDVFSLDIDGNDYYIAQAIFDAGFCPKIFVVEYNSVFGPERSVTIEYQEDFVNTKAHHTHLYYGVSISCWKKFFQSRGYQFVTVDTKGVNAFFVDPGAIDEKFLQGINGLNFAENIHQCSKFGMLSEEQFKLLDNSKLVTI